MARQNANALNLKLGNEQLMPKLYSFMYLLKRKKCVGAANFIFPEHKTGKGLVNQQVRNGRPASFLYSGGGWELFRTCWIFKS